MKNAADLMPVIEQAARDVHFTFGMELSEAVGILSLEVVERLDDYETLYDEGKLGLINTRLRRVGGDAARKDRVRRQVETDQYFYEPEYVRLFLPFFYKYEDWANGPINEDATAEWRTGEAIDTALDIKLAWPRLRGWQFDIINARHFECPAEDGTVDWDAVAARVGRKDAHSARTGYGQATVELTVEMNDARARRASTYDGPGSRESVSNAVALSLLA